MYNPPKNTLWTGRNDTARYHSVIQCKALEDVDGPGYAIIGFASDEGVRRNNGRQGAKDGPDALRESLASLPCNPGLLIYDIGTISCDEGDLESAQKELGEAVAELRETGLHPIVLGGGHETAWGHYQGLVASKKQIGIVNFDAHFDLRPLGQGALGSSGTPFLQIADHCEAAGRPFNYCVLGIQDQGNSPALFEKAKELGVNTLTAEDIAMKSPAWQKERLQGFVAAVDEVYLSICLDVFSSSAAPGVSAPQPFGLSPWQLLPLLDILLESGKVASMDIVELNPKYDVDHHTARLGAAVIARVLEKSMASG